MDLLVLLAYADFADDHHEAWPSRATVATKARIAQSTVQQATQRLETLGEIEVVSRGHLRRDKRRSNLVRIVLPSLRPADGHDPEAVIDSTGTGEGDDPEAVIDSTALAGQEPPRNVLTRTTKELARGARDEVWDTLVELFGEAPRDRRLRGAWNLAAKEIRSHGATRDEVRARFTRYRLSMPDAQCTPMALAKHWGRFGADVPATTSVHPLDAHIAQVRSGRRS